MAIDEPLEYARLALDGEMQAWVDAIDSLDVFMYFSENTGGAKLLCLI